MVAVVDFEVELQIHYPLTMTQELPELEQSQVALKAGRRSSLFPKRAILIYHVSFQILFVWFRVLFFTPFGVIFTPFGMIFDWFSLISD